MDWFRKEIERIAENELKLKGFFYKIPVEKTHKNCKHSLDNGGGCPDLDENGLVIGKYYFDGKELAENEILPFRKGQTFVTTGGQTGKITDWVQKYNRLAKPDEFDIVLKVEAANRKADPESIDFIEDLKNDIIDWIERHKNNTISDKSRDYEALEIGRSFLEYLEGLHKKAEQTPKEKIQIKEDSVTERVSYNLKDWLNNSSQYEKIMQYLVKTEAIDKDSRIHNTRVHYKNYLPAFIKHLGIKGFLNRGLNNRAVHQICKETFKYNGSIKTVENSDERKENFPINF